MSKPTILAGDPRERMCAVTVWTGDCRTVLPALPAESVQCCVTSPPYYGLRDYGCPGQIGLEQTPEAYVLELVQVFREVRRVLREDGTLWLNLGDSYANDTKWGGSSSGKHVQALHGNTGIGRCRHLTNLPAKNLIGIPWRVAFALQADGWILRSDIIWHKPNPMPESITDRPTKSHEYLFLFSKSPSYFYDADAIAENAVSDHDSGNGFTGRQGGATHLPMSGGAGTKEQWTRGERPQLRRAIEIAQEAGLTQAHFDAIRACGLTDTGKNRVTQTGTGKNDPQVQALADHAKSVLKGYYREFLSGRRKRGVPGYHQDYATNHTSLDNAPRGGRRNKRSVWTVATRAYRDAHFAVFPPALIRPCILAGSCAGDTILDPFGGSGTTGKVALDEGRSATLIELNPAYVELIDQRTSSPSFCFA